MGQDAEGAIKFKVPNKLTLLLTTCLSQYWDLRTPNAIATAQLAERCYSMDANWPYVVVGTAERKIQVFNLSQNPSKAILVRNQEDWQRGSL